MKVTRLGDLYKFLRPLGVAFNAAALAILAGLFLMGILTAITAGRLSQAQKLFQAKMSMLEAFERNLPNPPSPERFEFLAGEARRLEGLVREMEGKNFFWDRFQYTDKDRLEFKERVFDVQEKLAGLAQSRKVIFEKDAELPGFEGVLPEREDLPGLFMALALSGDLRKRLIVSGVPYVQVLHFPKAESAETGEGFKRFTFHLELKFESDWPAIVRFLDQVTQSPYLFRIEKVLIENKTEGQDVNSLGLSLPISATFNISGTFYGGKTRG